jgi:type VI protein secretion system component VasK
MTTELLNIANHASAQSDRWLFVALLVIGLFAIWILFRYFTARIDGLQERMDKQNEDFVTHLKTANAEMLTVIRSARDLIERVEKKINP